jgi:PRC-barrel domain
LAGSSSDRSWPGGLADGVEVAQCLGVRLEQGALAGVAVRGCGKKVGRFEAGDIREWPGQDVVDTGGRKIGELGAVYVDTATDLPSFGTVTVGLPTRHRLVFVPLDHATVGPGYVKVTYDKKQVKNAPSIGTDGELPAGDEEAVFKHYGLAYEPGAGGERRLARR